MLIQLMSFLLHGLQHGHVIRFVGRGSGNKFCAARVASGTIRAPTKDTPGDFMLHDKAISVRRWVWSNFETP